MRHLVLKHLLEFNIWFQANSEGDRQRCGLCMDIGPYGATKVESDEKYSEKCDVACLENGTPACVFAGLERGMSLNRFDGAAATDRRACQVCWIEGGRLRCKPCGDVIVVQSIARH